MLTSTDFKEQLQFPIKRIVIHIKYRDTYRLWKKVYRYIPTSYQVSFHLAKQFQMKSFFRNRKIKKKNCLWLPCLLTDQNEMSNPYRGPSNDASYQISVQLAKLFQSRRFFRNRPIRNKNCLQRPFLLMDRDKMSNLYRGPSIDTSYQVSVHLQSGFREDFQ